MLASASVAHNIRAISRLLRLIVLTCLVRIKYTKESSATTHELYMMAPESSSAARRRLRAEKRAAMEALMQQGGQPQAVKIKK